MSQLRRRKPARPKLKPWRSLFGARLAEELDHVPSPARRKEDQQYGRRKETGDEHQIKHQCVGKRNREDVDPARRPFAEPYREGANAFLDVGFDLVDVLTPVEAAKPKTKC